MTTTSLQQEDTARYFAMLRKDHDAIQEHLATIEEELHKPDRDIARLKGLTDTLRLCILDMAGMTVHFKKSLEPSLKTDMSLPEKL